MSEQAHSSASAARPRVLLLTTRADHGGGPGHVLQLARLMQADVELTIACPRQEPYWSRFAATVGDDAMIEIGQGPLLVPDIVTVARAVRRRDIDIVHSHGKKSGLVGRPAALLARSKAVHTYHGMHTERYGRAIATVYLALEWILSTITSACIAVSARERSQWADRRGCAGARLHHIPNGVAIPSVATASHRNPFTVAFVGRVTAVKNPELLREIIDRVHHSDLASQLRFAVVGDGEELPALRTALAAAEQDDVVEFHGFVDDVPNVLRECQAIISTSVREGLPLAVLEGFAHGLPVVATDVDGNHELLQQATPELLFPTGDADAAVARLRSLLTATTWQQAQDRVRTTAAQHYGERDMAAATVVLYQEILGRVAAPTSAQPAVAA